MIKKEIIKVLAHTYLIPEICGYDKQLPKEFSEGYRKAIEDISIKLCGRSGLIKLIKSVKEEKNER